jgi:hypothetical protein
MTGDSSIEAWEGALAGRDRVEGLVKGRLGCGCPVEVFDHIQRRRAAGPGLPEVFELQIGDRLLVHLADAAGVDRTTVEALLEQGRRLRDERGLNRFRLVLIGRGMEPLPSPPVDDDRLHLHVLSGL